jgi:hypothetical protein
MKKTEDASAKKKPKTSAAQIRVQKGVLCSNTYIICFIDDTLPRFNRTRPAIDHADTFFRSQRSPQLHFDHYAGRG